MANAIQTVRINVHVRVWVPLYLDACVWFAATFGVEPNIDKIIQFILKYGLDLTVADDGQTH